MHKPNQPPFPRLFSHEVSWTYIFTIYGHPTIFQHQSPFSFQRFYHTPKIENLPEQTILQREKRNESYLSDSPCSSLLSQKESGWNFIFQPLPLEQIELESSFQTCLTSHFSTSSISFLSFQDIKEVKRCHLCWHIYIKQGLFRKSFFISPIFSSKKCNINTNTLFLHKNRQFFPRIVKYFHHFSFSDNIPWSENCHDTSLRKSYGCCFPQSSAECHCISLIAFPCFHYYYSWRITMRKINYTYVMPRITSLWSLHTT